VPFNWLVIGIGDISRRRVIPAILDEPHSSLHALLTRNPEKAKDYTGARVYTDLDQALSDPAIDAVYVASPVALHAPQAAAALTAGKHVLCEKPLALRYSEAAALVKLANSAGKLFGVAYYRRLFPKVLRAKQLIAEGAIGHPVLAYASCHSWVPGPGREWLLDPAMAGGGPLYDIASHRIDALNFLFGIPRRATGLLSNAIHQLPVEDSATVLIDYESGARAIVDARWNSRCARDECRIVGTDGELDLTPLSGPELRYAGREESLPTHKNVHYPLIANFVDSVLEGVPLACTGEQAILTDWVTAEVTKHA
jgi:1,5-anhydro-D-fructose reductase (1,5-anhydro-D-mannitol-forming)